MGRSYVWCPPGHSSGAVAVSYLHQRPPGLCHVVRLFADDCLVYRAIHSHDDQVILDKDLASLQKWSERWRMSFNPRKCNVLQVSRGDPSSHFYQLCGEVLQKVSDAKYLGILISSDLSWDKHISDVAKRANYTLGLIRRNLRHCPRDAKTTAYFSLVRSTTDYCSAIWDPYLEKDKTKLERVNRRAARVVCNKTDPRDHTSVTNLLRDDLGWPTLEHRRRHLRLTLMYKICHQQIAVPPTQLLSPNRPTRSNHQFKYQIIRTHTEVYRNTFYPRTIPDWNRLPAEAVNCPSADSFRQRLAKLSP